MKDKILEICKENNGYITGKMAKEKGFHLLIYHVWQRMSH